MISIHPPPRGATKSCGCSAPKHKISIHTPTRGATFIISPTLEVDCHISIHTPTRGATGASNINVLSKGFQSTLLREERPYGQSLFIAMRRFQSTLLREERLFLFIFQVLYEEFQSTLLREERHICILTIITKR